MCRPVLKPCNFDPQDHALLSLPSEFSTQLPPEGGAFYHPDCLDASRLHYRSSWASMIHAAALWLNETGWTGICYLILLTYVINLLFAKLVLI